MQDSLSKNLKVFSLFCIGRKTKLPKNYRSLKITQLYSTWRSGRSRQVCDSATDSCFVSYFPSGQGSRGSWSPLASLFELPTDMVACWLGLGMLFWQILSLLAVCRLHRTPHMETANCHSTVGWSWVSLSLTASRLQPFLSIFGSAREYLA